MAEIDRIAMARGLCWEDNIGSGYECDDCENDARFHSIENEYPARSCWDCLSKYGELIRYYIRIKDRRKQERRSSKDMDTAEIVTKIAEYSGG